MTPPKASTRTERETPWPFVVHAQIVAVPAPLARVGIALLAVSILLQATIVAIMLHSPPYVLVRGG